MQIQNALNKIKIVEGASIDAKNTAKVFEVLNQVNFGGHVLVFNSKCGMFCIGAIKSDCDEVCAINNDFDQCFIDNCPNIDMIRFKNELMLKFMFDYGLIEPTLTKKDTKEVEYVDIALKTCKNVILITKSLNLETILKKYPIAKVMGNIQIKSYGTSNYHKNENKADDFVILLINCY